ncbi:FliH/SctL family protein [Sphingomonas pokkalii]|uniref:Flagellar assembly protein FliH n=1 Tax=Sphingomonas pokkalii TaxID=2175090 RepID=A0A2U0SFY4_9SPHN|nr:FliH/SctL family protein [Sphingomonas pokkalii]PVX30286.1 flagellar assembly protein FliH [Sphingomonas pokkalii]
MSIHVERFAFDRVFSAPVPEKKLVDEDALIELAALRAEIALLKSDQEAVIARARAEGFEAGLAQARSEREVALLNAVDALHAGIEVIDAQFTEITDRVTSEATEVALAAADHIAARAIERAPGDAVDAAIGRVLGQVARGTELQVRVHPDLVDDIEAKIADRQSKDRRRLNLSVAPDATLAMGDALINWDEGGLALSAQARRDAIAAELESLLLH